MRPLDAADWSFPIPIAYGPGRIHELGSICARLGMTNPLVVTDAGSAELSFVSTAVDSIAAAGIRRGVFTDIAPNPTNANIVGGRNAFRAGGHDAVIAIGGGSGMDGGKAISLVANNDIDLWAFDYDLGRSPGIDPGGLVPLLTVPTTAGTGAETESTAMVTDVEAGVKRCIWHEGHKPSLALLDPELTLGLPPNLTAWTGVDALVHAFEAFSVDAWHPLCDGLALEAMRLIADALPKAFADGGDLEARANMLVGSCLAGVSFLKGLGLVHALSHMIGAVHDTHHGLTNAVLLPSVLRFNRDALGDKVASMAAAVGADTFSGATSASSEASFLSLDGWVVAMLDAVEIPSALADIGVEPDRVDEIAVKAMGDAAASTNPRPATSEELVGLLNETLTRAR